MYTAHTHTHEHICRNIHTCTHTIIHVHSHRHTYTHEELTYTLTHMHMHTFYTHMHTLMYMQTHAHSHTPMYTCVYTQYVLFSVKLLSLSKMTLRFIQFVMCLSNSLFLELNCIPFSILHIYQIAFTHS